MDVEKAISFVRANGNKMEQARLNKLLGQGFDQDEILNGFAVLQNPDGGFPFIDKVGYPSCLSNTALALHTLLEMDLIESEPATRAIEFLLSHQGEDGSWEENPQIKPLEPPFWDMPGDSKTTSWLTSDITDLLIRAGRKGEPAVLKSVGYLKRKQTPQGDFDGFIHSTWMALSIFGKNGIDDLNVWTKALKHLEIQDLKEWDASCIVWCLDCLQVGGIPEDSELWARLFTRLDELQCEDGSWPSEDGEEYDVQTTNSILLVSRKGQ